MKTKSRSLLSAALAAYAIALLAGCSESAEKADTAWAAPIDIAGSIAGLGGAARLHKIQDMLIGVQSLGNGSATLLFPIPSNNSWTTVSANLPSSYAWGYAAIDPQTRKVLLPEGYAENEQLVMKVMMGTITERGTLQNVTERTWLSDKKTLLGDTGPNVKLNLPPARPDRPNRSGAIMGRGILEGSVAYVPYSFSAKTFTPPNTYADGPHSSGVFVSDDGGRTWRLERISDRGDAGAPNLCQTTGHLYDFGGALWYSRKVRTARVWDEPRDLTDTFAIVNRFYDVAAEGDTAHVCWMDRRHNKWRFNIDAAPIENNEIYYRYRKDSDPDWSKEVLLSKGMLYSYAPSISAESNNVVVVWAGIHSAGKQHSDMGPNDIYYVTSKDGGKTWTNPLKVTDGAKDGITAGMPQVALLNGVIHLLYIQGKLAKRSEISPGMTKLGLDPWPIYYTQRPFPN